MSVESKVMQPSRLPGWAVLLCGISHRALAAALIGLMAGFPVRAQQLPTGGNVTAGSATIVQPNANTLNINQSTNQAIINWQSFSVGQSATVNFNQPGASSATLNRVIGTSASMIAGMINAPGTVLLINPNGIAITKSGRINVGSFAASTLNIKDSDFLAGNYKFTGNGGSAAVTNAGRINVSDGGFAALLGGQVSNSGTISARLGKVGLGAGEMVTLDFAGDGFLSVAVPSSQLGNLVDPNGALVTNSGKIRANGGQVFLSAATAANVLRDAVNVPGSIRANSVGTHNGRIVIGGGAGGKVNVSGKLAASGNNKRNPSKSVAGGSIELTGAQVNVTGKLDVSGTTGGNVTVQSGDAGISGSIAATSHAGTGGTVEVSTNNLIITGNINVSGATGGSVITYATASALITGSVRAQGLVATGGAISVTSADVKLVGAKLDASGATGGGKIQIGGGYQGTGSLAHALNVVIDPSSVIRADALLKGDGGTVIVWSDKHTTFAGNISAKGGAQGGNGGFAEVSGKETLSYSGSVDLSAKKGAFGTLLLDPNDFTIAAAGGDATGASIAATLATANVIISSNSGATGTNGDIFVNDAITWTSTNSLTLNAVRNIAVNAAITGTSGTLALNAGQGNAAGTITQSASGPISVNTLTLSSTGGNATLSSFDNSITNLGTVSLGAGALNLSNNKSLTVSGPVGATGGITLSALGALTINDNLNAGAGSVVLVASGAGNNIAQTAGAITAGSLILLGDNNATLTSATNSVGFLSATLNAATSTLNLVNTGDLSVLGATAAGGVTVQTAGALNISGALNAGASAVSLTTTGSGNAITQAAAGVITTSALTLATNNSNATLNTATNAVSALGTVSIGNGALALTTAKAGTFTLSGATTTANGGIAVTNTTGNLSTTGVVQASNGAVALTATAGNIVTGGSVIANGGSTSLTATNGSITLGGSLTGAGVSLTSAASLTLNQNIFGNAGDVVLNATGAGSNITQTAGRVQGAGLVATALNGSVTITAGAANNAVATIAGRSGGTFAYTAAQSTALTIGTVSGTSGIISSNGNVAVRLTNPTTLMTVSQAVTASNGDVTLLSGGNLAINNAVTAKAGTGVISLTSTTGAVSENSSGALSGGGLAVSAGTNIDLRNNNTVGRFAANAASGTVVFINDGGVVIDQVGSVSGITGTNVVLLTSAAGDITQTASGIITTTGGLLVNAGAGSVILDQANVVAGNFATGGMAVGNVTLRNTGNLNVGAAGVAGIVTASGIAINNTLSLISDTGAITQSAAITAGTVQGTTLTGGSMTLFNAGNNILNLGASSVGAGQLWLLSGASSLTVTGAVSATGGVVLQTPSFLQINNTINAGPSGVSLSQTTATNGFITQNSPGVITAGSLAVLAAGEVVLGASNNVGAISGSSSNGQFVFFNNRGAGNTLTVQGIVNTGGRVWITENLGNMTVTDAINSNGQTVVLQAGGALAVNAAVTAAGSSVGLQGNAGITQSAAGVITAANLLGFSGAGNIVLTQSNAVGGNVGFAATNGSVSFNSTSGFNVGGISAVDAFSVANPGIRTSLAGSTTLTAGGAITQSSGATDIVSTGTLNLSTTGNTNASLGNGNNAITNLGTVSIGTGALALADTGGLTVTGAVNALSVQVTTTGTIVIDNTITATGSGTPFIWLTASGAGSNITQTANGGLVSPRLELDATGGSVNATAGAANNNVTFLGGRSSGDFAYADGNSTALLISTVVGATPGIVSTNGSISVSATKAGAQMQVSRDVTASNGNVTLLADSNLFIGSGVAGAGNGTVTANGTTGVIALTSNNGSVSEITGGSLSGAQLAASAGTNVDLRTSNTIGTFAANAANGYVVLFNNGSIALDQVGAVNGVTAFGDVVLATVTDGNITQTANGKITTGGGLVLQALNGSITLDQANSVSGNFAVAGSSSTDVTLRNTGNLNIGSVTPSAIGATFSGVAISGTLSLNSNSGSVTQSSAIIAGTIQGSTGGGNMTLTNASNQFGSVGPTSLGAGALSLFDSTGGLTVTGAVSAGGGISLQTAGALAINNTLNGGVGTVSLTTTNAGAAITQNASGVITAGTLALSTNDGNATLDFANNAVSGLGTVALGAGLLRLYSGVDLTLTGAVTANGGVTISSGGFIATNAGATITTNNTEIALTAGGDITVGDTVTSNGGVVAFQAGATKTLTINAEVNAGAGNVFLTADNMTIAAPVRNTGSVNIATVTGNRAITLGDAPVPAGLVIDYAGSNELNQFIGMSAFNVGKTRAGTTNAGAIQLGTGVIPTDAVNLFTTAGVTQVAAVVFIGSTGAGTLTITAGNTVDLRPGVAAGLIQGSASGPGAHFIAYGGGLTINIGPITTGGGDIAVGNNNGSVNVVGDLTSNGGHINGFSAGVLTLGANLDARKAGGPDGSIGLAAVGGINQTAGGLKGKDLLAFLCSNGCGSSARNIALDSTTNAISGNVTLVNLTGGNINFTNSSAYTVGGISSITYNSIGLFDVAPFTAGLGGPGIRTSGTGAVTLTAGGDIGQALGVDDIVSTNTLVVGRLAGFNPNVALDNANAIANLGTVGLGTGTFRLYTQSNLTITGAATTGGYDVTADNLTQNAGANIDTSGVANGIISLAACGCGGGNIILNADLNAGTGNGRVFLTGGTITQPAGAVIARTLNVQATNATLDSTTNNFAVINAFMDANLSATTSRSLSIGSNAVQSNSGSITLTALGATSDITVLGSTSVGGPGATNITLNAGHDVLTTGAVLGSGTVLLKGGRDVRVNFDAFAGVAGNDVTLDGARDVLVNGNVNASQTVSLLAGRDVTDASTSRIVTSGLRAVATTGAVNLSNSGNHSIDTLAGSANGTFSYKQDGNLTIGSVGATAGITSANGGVTVDAGTGTVTIDALARVIANSEIVLAGSSFKNNRGSDAVASTAGRWLVYANAPGTAADYNGLNSGNTAIWGTTYPATVSATGNRYVFATTPTVTLSPNDATKVYGQVAVMTYSATGLQPGVAGAYLADTLATATTGTPALTSAGFAANASVAGSPYAITIALGSLAGLNGYIVNVGGTGNLTVTPATLTYLATAASRTSGTPNPVFTGSVTGFVNAETLATATTGTAAWNSPAASSSPPGNYAIIGSGLSAANYIFVQAASNATALTITPAPNNPTSQVTPPSNNPPNRGVNITYQNNPTGLANISFTTGAAPRTAAAPTDVVTAGNPDAANRTANNGFNYQPISEFDANQYSGFQLPDYADKAGQAAIFTMISRAVQPGNAADFMIDGFWTGNDAAWAKGSDGKPVANRVSFSDGAGKTVSPTESNGFPVEAGKTDLLAMLGKGPVMLAGAGTPVAWLLAVKASDDGKGIIANDPISGRQVLLSYDAGTKTVGGVTGIFDAKTQTFVALSEAAATQQAGEPALKADSLAPLQNFTPTTFFAVTVK